MTAGDAFVLEDADGMKEHLHVVLTSPSPANEVITVSISTQQRWSETLVCLMPGVHPWVTRDSVVAYRFAAIRSCELIERAIAYGEGRWHSRVSDPLLARITSGLVDSDFTPPAVRAHYKSLLDV